MTQAGMEADAITTQPLMANMPNITVSSEETNIVTTQPNSKELPEEEKKQNQYSQFNSSNAPLNPPLQRTHIAQNAVVNNKNSSCCCACLDGRNSCHCENCDCGDCDCDCGDCDCCDCDCSGCDCSVCDCCDCNDCDCGDCFGDLALGCSQCCLQFACAFLDD